MKKTPLDSAPHTNVPPIKDITRAALEALSIRSLTEWDSLVFLYRHGSNLDGTGRIAALIGYEESEILAALRRLEEIGLVHRSPSSGGARFYKCLAHVDPLRCEAFLTLMRFAQNRAGRILLVRRLMLQRQGRLPNRDGGLHLA